MKSEKKVFWKRMLAKMLVASMVISMAAAIPVGAIDGETADDAAKDGIGGTAIAAYTATDDATSNPSGEEPDDQKPTTEVVSATFGITLSGATVYRVEIDGEKASASGASYSATLAIKETHTARALIQTADGTYGIVSGSGSTSIVMDSFEAIQKTTTAEETVVLDATDKNAIAQGGNLLVTWDALGSTSGTTKYTLSDSQGIATQTSNGVEFTKPGSVTVSVESFVQGNTIAEASLTEKQVTLAVEQKQLTAADVVASVTPASGTVDSSVSIGVTVSMNGVSNYNDLHGTVSYVLSENSKKYATLKDGTLTIKKADKNSDAKITLDVTVAESAFFGGVTVTSNDVLAVRKTDTIDLNDISTDADILNQKGIKLPEKSQGGQTITYEVVGNNGSITVKDNELTVSEANLAKAVGTWKIRATIPGDEYYQNGEKTVTLTVAAGAKFEKEPAGDMTWLSNELKVDEDDKEGNKTYTNAISGAAAGTWEYSIEAVINDEGKEVANTDDWSNTATIDEKTGKVTMKTAGAVTVTATRKADKIKQSYKLVVWKATLVPVFSPDEAELTYGEQDSYTLPLRVKVGDETIDVPQDAEIHWTLSDDNTLVSEPDDKFETKLASQSENGSAEFTAAVKENKRYAASKSENEAMFTLNVNFAAVDEDVAASYTTSEPNGNNWYVPGEGKTAAQNVKFTAKEGYQISATGVLTDNESDWHTEITLADIVKEKEQEGANLGENAVLYVRDEKSGAIAKIPLKGYKVDNTAPTMTVEYSKSVSEILKETVCYIFFNKKENDVGNLTIKVKPTEETSGIASISWGMSDGENEVEYIDFAAEDGVFESGKEYSFNMNNVDDFRSALSFKIVDNSGQETIVNDRAKEFVVLDSIAPEISVSYANIVRQCVKGKYLENENGLDESASALFAQGDVTVTIDVTEENFDAERFKIEVKENGKLTGKEYSFNEEEKNVTITLPKVEGEETVYNLVVSGTDLADNDIKEYTKCGSFSDGVYTSCDIVVDDVAPKFSVSYDNPVRYINEDGTAAEKETENCKVVYADTATATVTVDEQYFDAADYTVTVDGENYAVEWNTEGQTHTAAVELPKIEGEEHEYVIGVKGHDIALHPQVENNAQFKANEIMQSGNDGIYTSKNIVVDNKAPEFSISYDNPVRYINEDGKVAEEETENCKVVYADTATATVTVNEQYFDAADYTVTVDGKNYAVEWNTEGQTHTATVELSKIDGEEHEYVIRVIGTDIAANAQIENQAAYEAGKVEEGQYTSKNILVDDKVSVVTISYDESNLQAYVDADEKHAEKDQATTAVYSGDVVATVSVDEQYFDSADSDIQIKTSKEATVEWNGNVATVTIPAKEKASEDIYAITVDGTDIARHPFTYGSNGADFGAVEDSEATSAKSLYVSKELLIDTMAPRVAIDYTNDKNDGAVDGFFTGRSASITVEDASFDPSVERVTVTAVDAKGNKVDVKDVKLGDWERDEQNADQWTNAIDFSVEGNYTFEIGIKDNAEHPFTKAAVTEDEGQHISDEDGTYSAQFTVDNTTPTELKVTYSENIVTAILNGITFGFYSKNQPLTLNIETVDNISGVQHMSFTYNREAGASTVNADTLTVPYDYKTELDGYTLGAASIFESETYDGSDGQLRGQFEYVVMDYAGNVLSNTDQDDANHENGQIGEIVDSISPTATITYSGAVNSSTASNNENPNGVLAYYFNASELTVPIKITEANFIPSDVHVSVRRNSESDSAFKSVNVTWSATGKQDEYVGYVTLSEPDSYYNIKVEYADHSENPMQMTDTINRSYSSTASYVSPRLVLDTTAPVVSVSYDGSYRTGEMDFYSTTAVATIRVREKNFCAEEATKAITIRGQNIDGAATDVPYVSSWSYVGDDMYTATITYYNDSRYTFDMNYSDLVKLRQTTSVKKTFTVDKTAPSNLNISYSTDVWGVAAGSILWYDAPVRVTLTAYDVTAGVETITYSYPTKAGVSSVNVGMSDVSVSVNATTSSVEYSFSIPSSVLIRTNQFNGTVNFTAVDRSGNRTSFNGTNELVVDNIAPNATITYTTPVSSDETADYYDKDFEARVEINEANFNASNVNISVVKDDAPYTDFSYSFTDESVDVHVATLHFSENGEYVIQVEYTDQSKNQMVDETGETKDGRYTSRVKTIDKDQPAITITDMMGRENPNQIAYDRNNEDSKGNKHTNITFTVNVEDDHLLEDGIDVSLRGFEPQKDDADLKTYTYVDETEHYVSATASVLEAGKSYAISVENIEKDAVYFLNCSATDQSGNLTTRNIKFSVNRDGSTYYVEEAPGEGNDGYTNTQSEAIIHEISVEPLSQTDVTVVRDSTSQVLKQDEEYEVSSEAGQDENWNDYTYTVYADNFKTDGVYAVQTNSVTEQKDQGGTEQASSSANNDEAAIRFVMDTVAPEAYISGIVENGQYQTNEQPITITISDNTMLASAKLSIDNAEETIDLSDGFDGTYATTISAKNHDQDVKVYVTDKAGNEYELSMDGIRVSTNIFFLHWEIFVVCGVVLLILIAIMIGVIVSRKKKRTTANV